MASKVERNKWKKKKQIIIKKIPRCYTHTGYEFNNIKIIEKLILPVLYSTSYFNVGDIKNIELLKILRTKNKIPINKIKHNIKITVEDTFDLNKIDNVKLLIGYGESIMQIYKTRMDIEMEKKHICEAMMKKCTHCGIIDHTRYNCPEFNRQRKEKSKGIEKEGYAKQSKEYRQKIREWRAIPICDRCGDLEKPHKSYGCKENFKCNNCKSNEHKTKDYNVCPRAIDLMTSILEYLVRRYGKEYKKRSDEIRMDHKYGIGKYEIKIYGKDDKQVKVINNKKFERRNDNNKQKLELAMLKRLQEKDKEGKLDESDDDSDNLIAEMEEMMNKENIGVENKCRHQVRMM